MRRRPEGGPAQPPEHRALKRRLGTAMEIAQEAGQLALRLRTRGLGPAVVKGRHDVATAAGIHALVELIGYHLQNMHQK